MTAAKHIIFFALLAFAANNKKIPYRAMFWG